jgi:DNA-binding response OmpR family regulator
MRILIIEDDTALASFIRKGLEAEHYAVDTAPEGEQGRSMALEFDYDLLILDLNLPGIDGLAILTARSRVEDRVQCLDMGADDYLVKPFSFLELSARTRALLRRSHLPSESVLAVRDLRLDRVERRVERSGRRIDLTTKEFALLEYLMRNAGRRLNPRHDHRTRVESDFRFHHQRGGCLHQLPAPQGGRWIFTALDPYRSGVGYELSPAGATA